MAGHASVIAAVLNQSDLLAPAQAEDCVSDLRRLLDSEGLHDARVVVTSAVSGAGVPDLRTALIDTVIARRAAVERIGADVDALAVRFVPYAGEISDALAPGPAGDQDGPAVKTLPAETTNELAEALSRAAGVSGVGKTLQSARELKAVDYVGWPVTWLADRVLGRDPVRKVRLGTLWEELRGAASGSIGAQQPEIDNAITTVAEEAGRGRERGGEDAAERQGAEGR